MAVAVIFNFACFSCLAQLDMGHSIHQTLPRRSLEEFFLGHFFCLDCCIVCRMACCKIMKIVAIECNKAKWRTRKDESAYI